MNLKVMIPQYESASILYIMGKQTQTGNELSYEKILVNKQMLKDYGELIKSDYILKPVIFESSLDMKPYELADRMSTSFRGDTNIMELVVRDNDPQMARKLADKISSVFVRKSKELTGQDNVQILGSAELPENPSSPKILLSVLIAAATSLLGGIAIIMAADYFDDSMTSETSAESISGMRVMGVIPGIRHKGSGCFIRNKCLSICLPRKESVLEAYRMLRSAVTHTITWTNADTAMFADGIPGSDTLQIQGTAIGHSKGVSARIGFGSVKNQSPVSNAWPVSDRLSIPNGPSTYSSIGAGMGIGTAATAAAGTARGPIGKIRIISVTCPVSREKKWASSVCLASAFARAGIKILLIDANIREVSIPFYKKWIRHKETVHLKGLSEFLQGLAQPYEIIHKTDHEDISYMPPGRKVKNSSELLLSKQFQTILKMAADIFPLIIIDSPAAADIADGIDISALADAVLLDVIERHTPSGKLKKAADAFRASGIATAGIVYHK